MRRSIVKFLSRIQGANRYVYLKEYEQFQWLSLDTLLDRQFKDLTQLLHHANDTTPYYRSLFQRIGCLPEDIRSRDDFTRLPILTKKLIKTHSPEMLSSMFPKEDLMQNTSGGSTGEPLSFFQHREVYEQMYANQMLALKIAGWSGKEHIVQLWGNPKDSQKSSLGKDLKDMLTKNTILNAYNYNDVVISQWIKIIQKKSSTFIYGYVSVLKDVAEHILIHGIAITNVLGVMTSAEQLLHWQRELIEKAFCCKTYDQYGSREIPGISCECPKGGMHLLTHSAYVEFLPDENQTEDMKKLIVTSLSNYAMPFIRYEIGDYAVPRQSNCKCGRGFPLMEMKIGRMTDKFITPNGNSIYGTFFVRQMYGIDRVKNFQFRQMDSRHITLFVVCGDFFNQKDRKEIDQIENKIKVATDWDDLSLSVEYVNDIPKTAGGKHRHVVSEIVEKHEK